MPSKRRTKTTRTRRQSREQAQKNRSFVFVMVLAAVLLFSATAYYVFTRQGSDALTYKSCKAPAVAKYKTDRSKYPVDGYFVYTSSNQCTGRNHMHEARQTGAKTSITFGSRILSSSKSSLAKDSVFKHFRIGGRTGYDHALRQTDGGKIRAVYTYSNKVSFSSNALKCGKRNGVQVVGSKMFTWWLFPVGGSYSGCTSPTKTYNLVVAYNPSAKEDADYNMVANAEALGMQVYLGLPWSKADSKAPYLADGDKYYQHTYGAFATRFGLTWQQRYGKSKAFAGVYATQEMVIGGKASVWQPSLNIYKIQSQVMSYTLGSSKRTLLVSPYASVKQHPLSGAAASLRNIVKHAKAGANVRVIIAPQDGVGTGQVPISQTTTLFKAAKQAGAWRTWANLEAFQSKRDSAGNRLPMPKDGKRFRQQVNNARSAKVDSIIVYSWNQARDSGVFKR